MYVRMYVRTYVCILRQVLLWIELEGGDGGGAAGLLGPELARRCRQAFEAARYTRSKLQVRLCGVRVCVCYVLCVRVCV